MKLLAFTDLHNSEKALTTIKEKIVKHNVDIILCLGDITNFASSPKHIIEELDKLGKLILFVYGNHDIGSGYEELIKKSKNWKDMHSSMIALGKLRIIGYGGNGFSREDKNFEKFISRVEKDLKKDNFVILMTHQPPYNTKLDDIGTGHAGNISYRKWIEKGIANIVVSGHLHETFRKSDKIGNSYLLNPGPYGVVLDLK